METVKILLILTILSLIPGQLIRIPLVAGAAAITVSDVFVFLTDVTFVISSLSISKKLKIVPTTFITGLLFTLWATASLILALNIFSINQITISSMFLVRFVGYLFLSIVVYNTIAKGQIKGWLDLILMIGLIFAILGILQFIIFSDLSFLTLYGWDPHIRRVVSTLLDPNFSGIIFAFFLAISVSMYLFLNKKIYLIASFIFLAALILTFSRSSYLAFLTIIITIGLVKSPKILIGLLTIFAIASLVLPQARSRIIGAITIDETAQARITSWQNATIILKDNLFFGVGFNTYRYAQAQYGFFTPDNPLGGHSGGGTDSSILLVAATTGIIGLFWYILFLFSQFSTYAKRIKSSYLHLGVFSSFLGLLIHSQFVNSLFFPQVTLLLWIFLGLVQRYDS